MTKDEQILNKIKDVVYRTDPKAEIILYGSRARETASVHSDWDVLILLNLKKLTFNFENKFIDDLYEIEIETGEVISPLIFTKNECPCTWYYRKYEHLCVSALWERDQYLCRVGHRKSS